MADTMGRTLYNKNLLAGQDRSDRFRRIDIPVEVFLATSFEERTDYVDGGLVRAGVGDCLHGSTVGNVIWWLSQTQLSNYWSGSGLHLRISPTRYRSVDVCAYLTPPQDDYPTTPPFLSIDVLSPDDYFQDFWEKQEDFSKMGVPNVWIVDPYRTRLYNFDGQSMSSVNELVTHDPHVVLTRADVFERERKPKQVS